MVNLIRSRLLANEELCSKLAKQLTSYGIVPAIFYNKASADVDLQEGNYPQIVFGVDKFTDPLHGVAGLLTVDIICSQVEGSANPEELERLVRESLEGVFFRAEENFILKWAKVEVFQEPASERLPLIVGATVSFEIYEFANVITQTPDPILALQEWTAKLNVVVIGLSDFGDSFVPTRDKPAFYFDTQDNNCAEQWHTVIFFDALIRCHVFAPDVHSRREWLTLFEQEILICPHIFLADGSPMRLEDCKLNFAANEIQGQMLLTFRYGVPRPRPYAHPLIGKDVSFSKRLRFQHSYDKRRD